MRSLGGVEEGDLPAMRETWVPSLGWKDALKEGKAPHDCILAWRIHGLYGPWGCKESDITERLSLPQTNVGEGYLCDTLLII